MCKRNLSNIYSITLFVNNSNRICAYHIDREWDAIEDSMAHKHKKANINNCQNPNGAIIQGEGAYRFRYDATLDEVDGNPLSDWIDCLSTSINIDYDLVINKFKAKMEKLK